MSEQWFDNELSKQAKMKRLITALLLFFLVVVILSSCSANYHLKRSKSHYDKAINKGYIERIDSVPKITSLKALPLNYSPKFNLYIENVIDTLIEQYCEDKAKGKQPLKEALKGTIKYFELDTTVQLENGVSVDILIKNGALSIVQTSYCLESTPVIIEDKAWSHKEFWFIVGALVFLLIVLYLSRR